MDILLLVIIFLVPAIIYFYVTSNLKKYNKIANNSKLTGKEIAEKILIQNGLEYVDIVETKEKFSYYDHNKKVLYLTTKIINIPSITSTIISSFNSCYAIFDVKNNILIKIKYLLNPIIKIITTYSYWVVIFGFILHWDNLMYAGIGFTVIGLVFYLLLLPLEINVSKKVITILKSLNLVSPVENEIFIKLAKINTYSNIGYMLYNSLRFFELILVKDDKTVDNK